MRKIIYLSLLILSIVLIALSRRFSDETRIDIIYPTTIGLIGIASMSLISIKMKVVNIILLIANSIGFVGAFFYFVHLPFGSTMILVWLISRFYINYEMFLDKLNLPSKTNIKFLIQATLIFSLLQSFLIFKTYWLVVGLSGLTSIVLAILTLIIIFKKELKDWFKNYIIQICIQNIFIVAWIITNYFK
jgi:hypothetical protein